MTTTDQLITLAERIARNLENVSRNEWMKWMQVVESTQLTTGIRYAQRMSQDVTVRSNIRQIYRTIAQVLPPFRADLERLSPEERRRVFGYISWLLKIQEENQRTRGGRIHEQKPSSRHSRYISRGGY